MSKRLKTSDAGADGGTVVVWFFYTGQADFVVPRDVTHVRIVPSIGVKVIPAYAFCDCKQLVKVELCEGIEEIGQSAFNGCKSLERLNFPSSVKKIGYRAFRNCEQLEELHLCEGIEKIDGYDSAGANRLTA